MALMMLAAAAVLVVGAGVVAGAELQVYPGADTPVQDAIDGAGAGDMIYVHAEGVLRECGCVETSYVDR